MKGLLLCVLVLALFDFSITNEERCQYCQKSFKTLSKHLWRCAKELQQEPSQVDRNHRNTMNHENYVETRDCSIVNVNNESDLTTVEEVITEYDERVQSETSSKSSDCKCHCGKICNGNRALRAHQRHYHVNDVPALRNLFNMNEENIQDSIAEDIEEIERNLPEKKLPRHGVKLTKTTNEWNTANDHFKCTMDLEIMNLQENIYNYFGRTFCTVNNDNPDTSTFKERYVHLSKRQLKKALTTLKSQSSYENTLEIRYVAKLIRKKYQKRPSNYESTKNHNESIDKNFWKYCKETVDPTEAVKPDFDMNTCQTHFRKTMKSNRTRKTYEYPSWMTRLDQPTSVFDLTMPTYREITKIINKIKSKKFAMST